MVRGRCADPIKEAERLGKLKQRAQERSQDPEWRQKNKDALKRTAQKRAEDPKWREWNKEMCERRSQNPEWRRKRKEAAQRLVQDPGYLRKLSDAAIKAERDPEMYKRRSQNPEWIRNHDEASRRLACDPGWKRNHKEAMQRRAEDPIIRMKNVESHLGGFWYGNVRYGTAPIYCERWKDVNPRVHAFFGFKCCLCKKPENGRSHIGHHVFYVKEACCWYDEDGEYYTNLNAPDQQEKGYLIGVNPNYFVILCQSCHGKTNGNFANRRKWADFFREMIDSQHGGKCYFTKEEMAAFSGNL